MGRRQPTGWMVWVRMLCALAVLSVGFAHRMPVASAAPSLPGTVIAADYLLPDGTTASLCMPETEKADGSKAPASGMPACEACRISTAVLIPLPPDTPGIPAGVVLAKLTPSYEAPATRPARSGNALSRAPPHHLI